MMKDILFGKSPALMFVIEGAAADEAGVVTTGNMHYRPHGCVHTVTTQHGATVLAVVWGRIELSELAGS